MRLFIFLFILIMDNSYNAYCQEDNVYDAVNQVIKDLEGEDWIAEGKPSCIFLVDKPRYDSFNLNDIDKLFHNESIQKYFSTQDKESFKQQVIKYKNFSYTQSKIIGKTILPSEDLSKLTKGYDNFWIEYEQHYGQNGFYEISFPLFSVDGSKMLISVESNLYRMDNHGSLLIYKKEGDKWVYWKALSVYL